MQTRGGKEIAILYIFANLWLAACCVHSQDLERVQNLSISASARKVPAGPKVQNVCTDHWIPNSCGFSLTTPGAMCKEASCTSRAAKCVVIQVLMAVKLNIWFDSLCKSVQSLGPLCPWQFGNERFRRLAEVNPINELCFKIMRALPRQWRPNIFL